MTKQTINQRIDNLESDIKEKADEIHFHPVLIAWLIIISIVLVLSLVIFNYHSNNNKCGLSCCLDKVATNYCINNNMTFTKGHYTNIFGSYTLSDDNQNTSYDFICHKLKETKDKHYIDTGEDIKFRFTMEEAKSCGYKN